MTLPTLRFFSRAEFKHPDDMDADFVLWLNSVRDHAGVPFILTSDFRTPAENAAVSGHAAHSLHELGCAVDFATASSRAHDRQQWREDLWDIVKAVMTVPTPAGRKIQLELTQGPTDWHVHLGLRLATSVVPNSISLTVD